MGETNVERSVAELKVWVNTEPEVPDTSDDLLKLFILQAEGNVDTAKGRILSYYSIRASAPELFTNRDVDNKQMKNILELYNTFISPRTTPAGYRVLLHHASKNDLKRYDMLAQMKYFLLTMDASLVDAPPCGGYIIIFDIATLCAGHLLKISPSGVQKTSNYLQDAFPVNIQNVFLVNASPVVDILMKTIKPFLNNGFMKKLTIIREGNMNKLYEKVPMDCLPSEYGGVLTESESMNEANTEKIRGLQSVFASEEGALKLLKVGH